MDRRTDRPLARLDLRWLDFFLPSSLVLHDCTPPSHSQEGTKPRYCTVHPDHAHDSEYPHNEQLESVLLVYLDTKWSHQNIRAASLAGSIILYAQHTFRGIIVLTIEYRCFAILRNCHDDAYALSALLVTTARRTSPRETGRWKPRHLSVVLHRHYPTRTILY
jgi:hypothetical protein